MIADNIWKEKVLDKLTKLKKLEEVFGSINNPSIIENSNKKKWGPWERKYHEISNRVKFLENLENNPALYSKALDSITDEQLFEMVKEPERKEMKTEATSWINEIFDFTNEETGKVDNYNSTVDRLKGTNYHQRGHYFINYEDGTKEHWLALYPMFNDSEIREGHKHETFILNFAKPVKEFCDVYTCIGCGAAGQGFTSLHSNYDSSSSDSWDIIQKGIPFEPWFDELTNTDFQRQPDGRILSKSGKYCLGNQNHHDDYHVWEGKSVLDKAKDGNPSGKSFEKAYGYIPREGTIQWKLSRDISKEVEWAEKRISYYADSLWKKPEFVSYKDKNIYQQKSMDIIISDFFKNREFVIEYLKEKHNKANVNDWLEKEIKKTFRDLISVKRNAYRYLELCLKKSLIENDIKVVKNEIVKNEIIVIPPLKDKPLSIREIWRHQIEKFEKEEKSKEFYNENSESKTISLDEFNKKASSLYQELILDLGF